ncbi:hypothetical protein B4096_0363 [Heyndrickxia coagulans]|uniref:Uncharacterized protein n=1 Tax=Heyndrickxia coagulans TaxID=1398 RepID=A0A0C5CAW5_HEYCO|nr:hypothetical protein SB48_HM08orf04858 [Heyndrickxia coagulans]KWZ84779.1 hypothetical protein HMPREF3213_00697 [Heyndrickxia coagulans]KYC62917.1 hypothetical protein B4100_0421 [Heyndrickxia coagulans]KYC73623.1 hypothetical protein B4096_0363 [Heyndrickxia coagulans]
MNLLLAKTNHSSFSFFSLPASSNKAFLHWGVRADAAYLPGNAPEKFIHA